MLLVNPVFTGREEIPDEALIAVVIFLGKGFFLRAGVLRGRGEGRTAGVLSVANSS